MLQRLVTGARQRDHATSLQRQLRWLSDRRRVMLKVAGAGSAVTVAS